MTSITFYKYDAKYYESTVTRGGFTNKKDALQDARFYGFTDIVITEENESRPQAN